MGGGGGGGSGRIKALSTQTSHPLQLYIYSLSAGFSPQIEQILYYMFIVLESFYMVIAPTSGVRSHRSIDGSPHHAAPPLVP